MKLEGPVKHDKSIPTDPSTLALSRFIRQNRRDDAMIARHREVCENPRCACKRGR